VKRFESPRARNRIDDLCPSVELLKRPKLPSSYPLFGDVGPLTFGRGGAIIQCVRHLAVGRIRRTDHALNDRPYFAGVASKPLLDLVMTLRRMVARRPNNARLPLDVARAHVIDDKVELTEAWAAYCEEIRRREQRRCLKSRPQRRLMLIGCIEFYLF
jgi:hypothetical protein